jgi:hypothetical protein
MLVALSVGTALGATPDYGQKNPSGNTQEPCANPSMLVKCLPQQIPWTFSPETPDGDGVHIVSLPMGGPGGAGQVTFWCLNQVGFLYYISVTGLDSNSVYTVTAMDQNGETYVVGVIHTNATGEGQLNGMLPLDAGGYELGITVLDANGNPVIFGGGGFLVV